MIHELMCHRTLPRSPQMKWTAGNIHSARFSAYRTPLNKRVDMDSQLADAVVSRKDPFSSVELTGIGDFLVRGSRGGTCCYSAPGRPFGARK